MVNANIDEVDLALLDGIHVNPRVGFDDLGKVLGISGVTAARRWRRLVDEGQAWVSSAIGPAIPVVGAFLESECEPGAAQWVADRWSAIPQAFSVHITTGRYNVYALVVAADEPMLARLLVDLMPAVKDVRAVRSSMMFRLFSGTYWRLGALSPAQARDVAIAPAQSAPRQFDDFDRRIYLALQQDGRLSYRELAARLDCSETMARRRLQTLTRLGSIGFRADFARAEAGWPVNIVLMLSVTEDVSVAEVGRTLVGWPETRVVASVLGGEAQLFVTVQVHELDALDEVIARVHRTLQGVSVLSRRVALRPVKSFGRLVDVDGRSHGLVPVDPWSPVA